MSKNVRVIFILAAVQVILAMAMSFSPNGADLQIIVAGLSFLSGLFLYISEGNTKMAALEVRLEALEAELKEMKTKQLDTGPIGNDPV